jgi:hypothetical protein
MLAAHALQAANVPLAASPDQLEMRPIFIGAMRSVQLRVSESADPPKLHEYPLYDYLLAARLRRDLQESPDENIDTAIDIFLKAHDGQPVTRNVRRDWLASLAQRRRWDWLLPRTASETDSAIICKRFEGRIATGDTDGLAREVLAQWSRVQKQSPDCQAAFSWLRHEGLITSALAEARVRAALVDEDPKLALEFLADVPATRADPLLQWAQLLQSPKSALTRLANRAAQSVETMRWSRALIAFRKQTLKAPRICLHCC